MIAPGIASAGLKAGQKSSGEAVWMYVHVCVRLCIVRA
jgi:hypothetical protein